MPRLMPEGLQINKINNYIKKETDIDPSRVDTKALVDPDLHFYENWNRMKKKLGITTKTQRRKKRRQSEERRGSRSAIEDLLEGDTARGLLDTYSVQELHDMRSDAARRSDESKRAPAASSKVEWVLNPSKVDITGVDSKKRG